MPFTDAMKAEPTFSAARGSLITFLLSYMICEVLSMTGY